LVRPGAFPFGVYSDLPRRCCTADPTGGRFFPQGSVRGGDAVNLPVSVYPERDFELYRH